MLLNNFIFHLKLNFKLLQFGTEPSIYTLKSCLNPKLWFLTWFITTVLDSILSEILVETFGYNRVQNFELKCRLLFCIDYILNRPSVWNFSL